MIADEELTAANNKIPYNDSKIKYEGAWQTRISSGFQSTVGGVKQSAASVAAGSTAEFSFTGTGFGIKGYTSKSQGEFKVAYKGYEETVNCFEADSIDNSFGALVYTSFEVPAGTHTVIITALGEKNIYLDEFLINGTLAEIGRAHV